jgi:N-acetyl-gamma-glutamylphosphate reductase
VKQKQKVGITGQSGFIGTHLFNFLSLKKEELTLIPFKDEYFQNLPQLESFVKQCDTIIHLAAMNRHGDPQHIYDTNIKLSTPAKQPAQNPISFSPPAPRKKKTIHMATQNARAASFSKTGPKKTMPVSRH